MQNYFSVVVGRIVLARLVPPPVGRTGEPDELAGGTLQEVASPCGQFPN